MDVRVAALSTYIYMDELSIRGSVKYIWIHLSMYEWQQKYIYGCIKYIWKC